MSSISCMAKQFFRGLNVHSKLVVSFLLEYDILFYDFLFASWIKLLVWIIIGQHVKGKQSEFSNWDQISHWVMREVPRAVVFMPTPYQIG
jgi:menaquinone-dependent protoporphyrinogen IX oxidase